MCSLDVTKTLDFMESARSLYYLVDGLYVAIRLTQPPFPTSITLVTNPQSEEDSERDDDDSEEILTAAHALTQAVTLTVTVKSNIHNIYY